MTALRCLKITILCACPAIFLASGMQATGSFSGMDAKLAAFLGWQIAPESSGLLQHLLIGIIAWATAWATLMIAQPILKFLIAAIAAAEIFSAAWVASTAGSFFSPFAPALALLTAFICTMIFHRASRLGQKTAAFELLGGRVSPATLAALSRREEPLKLDGEIRESTVLVCEVFNHEHLVSELHVSAYVEMTNTFLKTASDLLVEKGAYLDECDGESLRVIFGALEGDSRHAARACEAALALGLKLDAANREFQNLRGHALDFRIGINSGTVVLAAYGSERLASLSVAGESVEFARRLCAANIVYGARILIGTGTFISAETEIEVRPMELIQRHPSEESREEVYELIGMRGNLGADDCQRRDLFWKGIVFFRERKWDDALCAFKLAAELGSGGDAPAEFYIRRIEQLRAGILSLDNSNRQL